jgi:hypothetical protein
MAETTVERLVQLGCFAADDEVILAESRGCTPAGSTRVAIRAALTRLEAQGFITFTDPATWPEYFETVA